MSSGLLQIDFLPEQYHRKHANTQSRPWRWVVVVAFALVLAGAAMAQLYRRGHLAEQLALIEPQYQQAQEQNERLAELQQQLQQSRHAAELLTFLRHPWPRTQLIKALLRRLPDEVELTELEIASEAVNRRTAGANRFRLEREDKDEQQADLPPAQRDLNELRQATDGLRTLIRLGGTTTDGPALQRYILALGRNPLFSKAELEGAEIIDETTGAARFEALLTVRPGYGQPDGPTGLDETLAANRPR